MRMFISDSLRPPGLERLNDPGPSWAIREDSSSWLPESAHPGADYARARARGQRERAQGQRERPVGVPAPQWRPGAQTMAAAAAVSGGDPNARHALAEWRKLSGARAGSGRPGGAGVSPARAGVSPAPPGRPRARPPARPSAPPARPPAPLAPHRREGFVGAPAAPARATMAAPQAAATMAARAAAAELDPYGGVDPLDAPWRAGDAARTPEAAIAEYWGEGAVESSVGAVAPVLGAEQAGAAYGAVESWGARWQENGGTRFMRYEEIPFWQKGGRVGYDYDIEETLGTAGRELDSGVRRWDMERVRAEASAQQRAALRPPAPPTNYPRADLRPAERPPQWGRRFGPRSGGDV